MNKDCIFCDKEHIEPYINSMKFMQDHNIWDNLRSIMPLLHEVMDKRTMSEMIKGWSWVRNSPCKYVDIRIDMRNGGCIIKGESGKRISPSQLLYQYSAETADPIKDNEAYKE